jgi:hypothetical protein
MEDSSGLSASDKSDPKRATCEQIAWLTDLPGLADQHTFICTDFFTINYLATVIMAALRLSGCRSVAVASPLPRRSLHVRAMASKDAFTEENKASHIYTLAQ